MAEFILKDWHGKEKTFDHETIYVRGTDGELMPFTHGTGNPVLEELEVTKNGSYTPSEGVDGFGSVKVNVPDIPAVLQNKEVTENGEYTADEGYDGLSKIIVNVPDIPAVVQPLEVTENGEYAVPDGVDGFNSVKVAVPIPEPILESLEITENGTYTAPDGVDGFNSVTVNVGVAKIAVLEEHEMTGFAPDTVWGYSTLDQAPSYTINEGEQYYVKWDGETYPVMLTDGSAAIQGVKYLGNGSAFNLPGNGEPFAIVFVNGMILYTAMNDPKESHTIGIYKDGSAGSDELKYVTFMSYDGSTEYGKKAVANGDDCADPIARGVFSTPTRESDAQYTYTFYGWATEPNGGAVANWNKAINEDKTVYANFSKAVRYYTITYYDSDGTTVLKTESLAYGSTPSYMPRKDGGVIFKSWTPALATVTGDASYTASWIEAVSFAESTWADIAAISEAGMASTVFSLGDTRTENLGSDIGTVDLMIIGFDHDVKPDGTKIGITIGMMQTGSKLTKNNQYWYGITPSGGGPIDVQISTDISNLPSDLINVIKVVTKTTTQWVNDAMTLKTYNTRLFVFSSNELALSKPNWAWDIDDGTQAYAAVINGLFPKIPTNSKMHWLRGHSNAKGYTIRASNGTVNTVGYQTGCYMRYGFCV